MISRRVSAKKLITPLRFAAEGLFIAQSQIVGSGAKNHFLSGCMSIFIKVFSAQRTQSELRDTEEWPSMIIENDFWHPNHNCDIILMDKINVMNWLNYRGMGVFHKWSIPADILRHLRTPETPWYQGCIVCRRGEMSAEIETPLFNLKNSILVF